VLVLALLVAPGLAREPALVDAVKSGDGAFAQQTMELVLGDAREVELAGGDGEGWMAASLREAGLEQLSITVGREGGASFTVGSCQAQPDVYCPNDAFEGPDCSTLEANIHCSSPEPVPEAEEPIHASCGGKKLRVDLQDDGSVLIRHVDECFLAGLTELSLVAGPRPVYGAEAGLLGMLMDAGELDDVFNSAVADIEGDDDDPFAGLTSLGYGFGGGGEGGGGYRDSCGGGGGGASIAVYEPPPPPEPWPSWAAVTPHGSPVEAEAEALVIVGDAVYAAEDDTLVWLGLEDGQQRGHIVLGGHTQGREIDEMCVSPDATRLGVVWGSVGLDTDGGAYELWSLEGEQPTALLSERTRWSVHHCAFTADGRWFAVGARQGLWIYDAARGLERRSVGHKGDMLDQVTLLAAAPTGSKLLLLWGYEELNTLDAATGGQSGRETYDDLPLDAVWMPGGLYAFADSGTVLWRGGKGEQARGPGDGLAVAAVGAERVLASHERGPVVLDLQGEVVGGLGGPARRPEAIAASADGAWIVVATWEGLLRYRVMEDE
jgi:hypothetical protein